MWIENLISDTNFMCEVSYVFIINAYKLKCCKQSLQRNQWLLKHIVGNYSISYLHSPSGEYPPSLENDWSKNRIAYNVSKYLLPLRFQNIRYHFTMVLISPNI